VWPPPQKTGGGRRGGGGGGGGGPPLRLTHTYIPFTLPLEEGWSKHSGLEGDGI
jgi:hypothetical protein